MNLIFRKENIALTILPLLFSLIGLVFIYSTGQLDGGANTNLYLRQLFWIFTGIVLALIIVSFDYYYLMEMSLLYYIIGCIFLILTLILGREIKGAKSWFGVGGLGIQASELMKIAYILFYAKFLSNRNNLENPHLFFIKALGILLFPLLLVLAQPDLGTSLVFMAIFITMTLMGSRDIRLIIDLVATVLIAVIITLFYAYYRYYYIALGRAPILFLESFLQQNTFMILAVTLLLYTIIAFVIDLFKPITVISRFMRVSYIFGLAFLASEAVIRVLRPYQWRRLLIFINPEFDRLGAGYNVIQAQIAIGAGGVFGQGLFQGTQNLRRFLPEKHTDFIFAIIAEELGFLGAFSVLILYMIYMAMIIKTIVSAKDQEGALVASGILAMFVSHVIINIGMNLGIMPVTGLPLPMISYGGSSYIAFMIGSAIILSIYGRRFVH